MRRPSPTTVITTAFSLFLAVVLWLLFAPVQFGGQASYILVNGNSMEPVLHKGDLVVVRAANDLRVGDVVTYQYPEIGRVIHRIVSFDGLVYTLKGDNNDWLDGYTPSPLEIIGKYWFKVPRAAGVITTLRTPWVFTMLAGLMAFLIGASMIDPQNPRKTSTPRTSTAPSGGASLMLRWNENIWYLAAFLLLVFILLSIYSFLQPLTASAVTPVTYFHNGTFSYASNAGQGVYDGNNVTSGDPIFTALTCNVTMAFEYAISSEQPVSGGGSYTVTTQLTSPNGWHRTIDQTDPVTFEGTSAHIAQVINFCDLQAYVQRVQETTGITSQRYQVHIQPVVSFVGSTAGAVIDDKFTPTLTFNVEDNQVFLETTAADGSDPLNPFKQSAIPTIGTVANTFSLFGLKMPVQLGRILGMLGTVAALLLMLAGWLMHRKVSQMDDEARARAMFGDALVDVRYCPVTKADRVIDLNSLESLVQVAEKVGQMVLAHRTSDSLDFYVAQDNLYYRFRARHTVSTGDQG